tara:strand:- start:3004 stop:3870 length:867 start_codon:yes stop_codon:yes gene_type:complete
MKLVKVVKRVLLRYRMIKIHPLTKFSAFKAMFRYLYFNISQTLFLRPRVYNWIDGLKFYAEKGDAGLVGNIYYKLMDYEDSMFLIDHLKKDDLFVDVGANLGHYTLLASGICGSNVISVEPIKSTVSKLKKNVAVNNLSSKVSILNFGIGDKNETLNFTTNKTAMNSVSLEENVHTVKIEVKTLDEILKNYSPTFIKIDVEGYEYKVLKGALNILKKPSLKYLMVEFNESGKKFNLDDDIVFNLIVKHDFVPIEYYVNKKEINILSTYNTDKFNTLFVRKNILSKENA